MVHAKSRLYNRHLCHRRGTIYLVVLGMVMLIGIIGVAGLTVARIQLRTANAANDFSVARLCARAGMEAAMFKMRIDPTWRTDLGNGTWFNNVPLGQGSYTVTAVDPITGDITLPTNHPVALTSTGNKGSASYSLQATIQIGSAGMGCIGVNACSGNQLNLNNATLTSNQIVASNGTGGKAVNLGGTSLMNARVEAVGSCSGSTYASTPSTLLTPLSMPDPVHVFDSYVANGTSISYTSIPLFRQTQLISNGDFESVLSGWYVYSGSGSVRLQQDGAVAASGTYSMKVSSRKAVLDVAATDIPLSSMVNGHTYQLQMSIYTNIATAVQATLLLVNSTGAQFAYATPAATPISGYWSNLQGNVVASWTGTLAKATVLLTTMSTNQTYNMDKVQLKDVTYSDNTYLIEGQLLSPAVNPFGSTNASGIYVLNCGNQNLVIANSRIVGTLVLLNANNNTSVQGSMIWEPAIANYPALLVASNLSFSTTSAGLSESTYGVNFNPPGTPYPYNGGTSNNTQTDGFPSLIN